MGSAAVSIACLVLLAALYRTQRDDARRRDYLLLLPAYATVCIAAAIAAP